MWGTTSEINRWNEIREMPGNEDLGNVKTVLSPERSTKKKI
jgi:hypothetical protein